MYGKYSNVTDKNEMEKTHVRKIKLGRLQPEVVNNYLIKNDNGIKRIKKFT